MKGLCNARADLGLSLAGKSGQTQGCLWDFEEEQVSSQNPGTFEGVAWGQN